MVTVLNPVCRHLRRSRRACRGGIEPKLIVGGGFTTLLQFVLTADPDERHRHHGEAQALRHRTEEAEGQGRHLRSPGRGAVGRKHRGAPAAEPGAAGRHLAGGLRLPGLHRVGRHGPHPDDGELARHEPRIRVSWAGRDASSSAASRGAARPRSCSSRTSATTVAVRLAPRGPPGRRVHGRHRPERLPRVDGCDGATGPGGDGTGPTGPTGPTGANGDGGTDGSVRPHGIDREHRADRSQWSVRSERRRRVRPAQRASLGHRVCQD